MGSMWDELWDEYRKGPPLVSLHHRRKGERRHRQALAQQAAALKSREAGHG